VTYPADIESTVDADTETRVGTTARPKARGEASDTPSVVQRGADVSKQQAGQVLDEAKRQTADFLDAARTEATQQAAVQRDRTVQSLRTLGDELNEMAQNSSQQGTAADLVRQASDRARQVAQFLDEREPGQLLDEVRGYARRRPGTFLLGAVAMGVVAGRLTRAGAAGQRDHTPTMATNGGPMPTTAGSSRTTAAPTGAITATDGNR
jgi:hypothetical protein